MSDEDNELRDLVMQTLEVNGTLGKIKAQLRANVFLALEEQEKLQNKSPLLNKELKQFLSTKKGQLVGCLVREFLEYFDLHSSLAVFEPESGLGPDSLRRNALVKELNMIDDSDVSKSPLLLQVFQQKQDQSNLTNHMEQIITENQHSESVSDRKDNNNKSKNSKNPDINDILGSELDEDSFFDDPVQVFKSTSGESIDKSTLNATCEDKDNGDIFTLKDAPQFQPKKTEQESNKNLWALDKRLEDFGLGGGDDEIEYEDDFQSSGHSLSQKSPRLNSRSDAKSINENGSLAEEIEEDIEYFSNEGEDLKSGMDDFTTDCSISQTDRGFDYAEDLQLT
ncbi:centrosomal protein 43 isoform X1 [Patella vulgata]|uniref:centrosomal protein 43 isoform X1 n=1 Tax=Patella vulgata TaxID=6465 RepID=UPI00217F71A6|nr:centrosomal protein 43 isoform X1 [Patella vulgata]